MPRWRVPQTYGDCIQTERFPLQIPLSLAHSQIHFLYYVEVWLLHLCEYVQISVWPHNGVWAAVVKGRWLTPRDHGQKLPVDLLLVFTNRLDKHKENPWNKWRNASTQWAGITLVFVSDLLCCAARLGVVHLPRWVAVSWALHHFNGKDFLIHTWAGAVCHAAITGDTASNRN